MTTSPEHTQPLVMSSASWSSALPVAPSRPTRHRLGALAARYLNDFVANHGLNPTQEQTDALLAGVKAIPGHDYYTKNLLKHWFYARRSGIVQGSVVPATSQKEVSGLKTTTLASKQIDSLQKIVARASVIDDELLRVCAELLGVEKGVVEAWLHDNAVALPTPITPTHPTWAPAGLAEAAERAGVSVEEWRAGLSHGIATQRLPTPAETASPAPQSPVLLHANIQGPQSRIDAHLPPLQVAPSSSVTNTSSLGPCPDPIRSAIVLGIKDGASAPVQPLLKTAAEFNAFWATFHPKLSRVAQTLDPMQRP